MARPRSEFLSSLGKLFSIFKRVADAVLELGGNDAYIAMIDTEEQLAQDIARLIVGRLQHVRTETRHGWTLEYVWLDKDDTPFPLVLYNSDGGKRFYKGEGVCTRGEKLGYIVDLRLPYVEGGEPTIMAVFPRTTVFSRLKEPVAISQADLGL